jgi:DNA-binding LacI/PurR family transcriptional regulator
MIVTIREVAVDARVSTATVSHVLNKTGQVSRETRQRVLAAARKLGYVPNQHARSLAFGRSRTFGMIVSDVKNPFFPEVFRSFENRAQELGYEVTLSDTRYEPRLMRRAAERMLRHKVGGVAIMTSEMSPPLIKEIVRHQIAVICLDGTSCRPLVASIKIDYYSGIRQVVEHLFRLGHRRMVFVGGKATLKSNLARQRAYIECLRALSLEPGATLHGNLRFEGGYSAGLEILGMSPLPTAVVAINDLTAIGVIKALRQGGLRVPEDVSVAGFDKTEIAEYVLPSLTTVDIQRELLGRLAADALHELSSTPNAPGKEYVIPTSLVTGESTGPAGSPKALRPGRTVPPGG